VDDFYDNLAPYYHVVYADWEAGIVRQANWLHATIQAEWPGARSVLDAAAGIGTQSLGLAALGYRVSASDRSVVALARLREEARARGLAIETAVADLRDLSAIAGVFDVVIACDNALAHLLTDDDLSRALRQCYERARIDGGCLFTIRDYGALGTGSEMHPHGVRNTEDGRAIVFQVWDWDGAYYDSSMYIVREGPNGPPSTQVFRTRCHAISVNRLLELMQAAGFENVQRIDEGFYQPVLVGTKRARR
jgi:SAM-dependent methyltransferase